jgi:hypothetical protein
MGSCREAERRTGGDTAVNRRGWFLTGDLGGSHSRPPLRQGRLNSRQSVELGGKVLDVRFGYVVLVKVDFDPPRRCVIDTDTPYY